MWKKYPFLSGFMLCFYVAAQAQSDLIIGEMLMSGNKRTKDYIVERELPFRSGDTVKLASLQRLFETGKQQLMNTRLFNEVSISLLTLRGGFADIFIELKERWYLFPIPYLRPVDRNLSEWAKQGYGTDRLNYGFKFTQYNFSGRNDKLKLWLVTGYSKQINFEYEQPYSDRSLKHGFKIGFNYSSKKEVNFTTLSNQQQFSDSLGSLQVWSGHVEYNYRPALKTFHALRFSFHHLDVDQGILDRNPGYTKQGFARLNIPEIGYNVRHVNLDYVPYPLKGWPGEASLSKRGIHSHTTMWQLAAKYNLALPLGNKFYFNLQSQGLLRVPFDQPFYNNQLFGYGDMFLRGLEEYVIDGVAGVLSKQTIRRELLSFQVPTFLRSRSHDRIPFRIYAKAYADLGYARNKSFPNNSLVNRTLYTAGFGLDVVTFYDFVLRLDYSFNQLGQNGLFLHFKNDF